MDLKELEANLIEMKEIEYKFLVNKEKWNALEKTAPSLIVQGFLAKSENITIRIRIKKEKAFLTIKGKTVGITRTEFEYEIPFSDAEQILVEFTDKQIRKKRYIIPFKGHSWEVDVFEGHLSGLILAELEVGSETEKFEKPEWITKNISEDARYYNAVLIDTPGIPD